MRKPRSLDDSSMRWETLKAVRLPMHRIADAGLGDGSTIPQAMPACWRRTAQDAPRPRPLSLSVPLSLSNCGRLSRFKENFD